MTSWSDALQVLGFGEDGWGGVLLQATLMTLAVTLAALLIGAVLGSLGAAAKLSQRSWLRALGSAYTTVFRGLPELLVIYLVYFGGSALVTQLAALYGAQDSTGLPAFAAGALAVGVVSGAYQTEVLRGAYLAIAGGELEAARAVGMPTLLRWRRIALPQIGLYALPALGNIWQMTLKDSALISVTGLVEIMQTTQTAAGSTRQYLVFYGAGAVLYLVLTAASGVAFQHAEHRAPPRFRFGARPRGGAKAEAVA